MTNIKLLNPGLVIFNNNWPGNEWAYSYNATAWHEAT